MAWLRGIFITLLSLSSFNSLALAQESIRADHVKVSLVAPTQLEPGDNLFALRFEVDPHWHIYWKNPGDSGTAPRFAFDAKHAAVSDILWPVPKRILVGDFVNLGFEGEVLFPFTVRPGDTATSVEIKADLEWLVCEEECLPGEGVITFTRPVAEKAVWAGEDQKKLGDVMKALPMGSDVSPWSLKSMRMIEGNRVAFEVVHAEGNSIEGLTIFPEDGEVYKPKAPVISDDKKALILDVNANGKVPDVGSFLLVDERGAWTHKDFALTKSDVKMSEAGSLSTFLILLLSAFVGGIILNLMPCVLPVLSIKFFSLAKMNKETRWHEILYYTLGVLVTFTALGGIFLALRATGSAVGWGFQLQSPPIVLSLIMLFFLMGLSFLGFFEFGDAIVRSAGRFEQSGAFATGVLSVFIATPCTGPFMGTALGAAATLPAAYALTIFFFLGLGLASPFLLLAVFPNLRLPKPGNWMITLRQFLAFPLFGTVIWLLWVLGLQLGTDAWLYASALGLLFTFTIWLGKNRPRGVQVLAWLIALVAIGVTGKWVVTAPLVGMTEAQGTAVRWEDFDPKLIAEAKGKQPVFVDFTAAWCVTCQVNKKAVLETSAAEEVFLKHNVKLIRADWTNLDTKITDALAEFERASVPLYLFYPADGSKPKILPQILTLAEIEGLFP